MNKITAHFFIGFFIMLFFSLQVKAVDYELPDLNGQIQSLDQYKGKWVIVNYWATWCGTCIKELPDLISLHENNEAGDVVVVGVNFETISLKRLKNFVTKHAIPYTVLRTDPVALTPLGPVPALPATYIVDPNGKTVAGQVGIVTQKNLEDYIESKRADDDYAGTSMPQKLEIKS